MRPVPASCLCAFALALAFASIGLMPSAAVAARWARPVEGRVVRAFAVASNPYAAGQHRGVDLAATAGSRIGSACAGRVSFVGWVPAGGLTVSVRCGRYIATYQHMGEASPRAGAAVARGAPIGVAGGADRARGESPHVHFGVRVASTGRYVDPMSLIDGAPITVPPAAPREREPPISPARVPPLPAPMRLYRAPLAEARLGPAPAPARRLPWTVWTGLGLVALGLPTAGVIRVRARRRCAPRPLSQTA